MGVARTHATNPTHPGVDGDEDRGDNPGAQHRAHRLLVLVTLQKWRQRRPRGVAGADERDGRRRGGEAEGPEGREARDGRRAGGIAPGERKGFQPRGAPAGDGLAV